MRDLVGVAPPIRFGRSLEVTTVGTILSVRFVESHGCPVMRQPARVVSSTRANYHPERPIRSLTYATQQKC